jgi:broad specificity phosphatase PhoE
VSSPLARARETAEIVARELSLPIVDDAGLCEVNFGAWAGLAYDEVVRTAEFADYAADPVCVAPPDGETLLAVQERGLRALGRLLGDSGAPRVLAISHGDIIRALLCHLLAIDLKEYNRLRVENCSVSMAEFRNGSVRLRFINMLPDAGRVWRSLGGDSSERTSG